MIHISENGEWIVKLDNWKFNTKQITDESNIKSRVGETYIGLDWLTLNVCSIWIQWLTILAYDPEKHNSETVRDTKQSEIVANRKNKKFITAAKLNIHNVDR